MKKGLFVIIISSLLLLACESRTPKARQAVMDYETGVVQRKPDKVVILEIITGFFYSI